MNEFVSSHQQAAGSTLPTASASDEATVALLGHDLRAALSDVIGGLRLIDPKGLEPLTRVQIERVRAAAEGLGRLLEQGLTAMAGGDGPEPPHILDLQRFLTDLDLRWSGRALEHGIRFVFRKAADLPTRLCIDQVSLDRVLSNLLGNAFKYGARGQVACDAVRQTDGWLTFCVCDDGPGFPQSILDRRFAADARPVGLARPGSGLGLQIAADLTQRMGGRLTLRNRPDGGAEARVDLPVVEMGRSEAETADARPILAGKRVLIADDNPTSRALLGHLARSLGAEVVAAGDGVETVGLLEREAFDLLIVDVEMPRRSGLDVMRCLRAMPGAVGRMPVIAVTGYRLRSDRKAILAAGANDLLSKPLTCPQAFIDVVRQVMVADPGPLPVQVPPPVAPALDESHLQRLLDMVGPDTGQELLDRLLDDLFQAQQGLARAASPPDWQAMRDHSHVLISLAGAIGAHQLQAGAEALNLAAHRMDGSGSAELMTSLCNQLDAVIPVIAGMRAHHLVQCG